MDPHAAANAAHHLAAEAARISTTINNHRINRPDSWKARANEALDWLEQLDRFNAQIAEIRRTYPEQFSSGQLGQLETRMHNVRTKVMTLIRLTISALNEPGPHP